MIRNSILYQYVSFAPNVLHFSALVIYCISDHREKAFYRNPLVENLWSLAQNWPVGFISLYKCPTQAVEW